MEADAAERAALKKASAEQLDRALLVEMLRACAPLEREHDWAVKPPHTQK